MRKDYFTLEKSDTYRIVNEAGKTLSSFTLDDNNQAVSIYIERPRPALERPVKYLERKAWHYYTSLFDTLNDIEEIDENAATNLFAEMFKDYIEEQE